MSLVTGCVSWLVWGFFSNTVQTRSDSPPSLLFNGYQNTSLSVKLASAWSWPLTSNYSPGYQWHCTSSPLYAFTTRTRTTFYIYDFKIIWIFNRQLCFKMYMVLQTSRFTVLLSVWRHDLITSVCTDSTGNSALWCWNQYLNRWNRHVDHGLGACVKCAQ